MKYFLESCCTSLEEVLEGQQRGCSRIELCQELAIGGMTPSRELLKQVLAVATVPVNVLIRPRGGNFTFTEQELLTMIADIEFCRNAGANAVVIGALDKNGNVDMPAMKRLTATAGPLKVTFHRAFDVCADPLQAIEDIIALGCDILLTSGHKPDALTGSPLIKQLIERSQGRITVMPGCGVRAGNIDRIAERTGASEFHASASFWR